MSLAAAESKNPQRDVPKVSQPWAPQDNTPYDYDL